MIYLIYLLCSASLRLSISLVVYAENLVYHLLVCLLGEELAEGEDVLDQTEHGGKGPFSILRTVLTLMPASAAKDRQLLITDLRIAHSVLKILSYFIVG